LNLLLDERSGRIQGLKAASTTKSKNDFKFMDELDRFWPRFGEHRLGFSYRRDRDDGTGYNEGRQLRRLHRVD
jgi:hypothetical protein